MREKRVTFSPAWRETPPVKGSFRSIFKFGDPEGFRHPNQFFYEELKRFFGLTDNNFKVPVNTGDELVDMNFPSLISQEHLDSFVSIVGAGNVSEDTFSRIKYSTGQTVQEALNLRRGITGPAADLVVHPRNKEDVRQIVDYCNSNGIPVYVFGGGSSVNLGLTPVKGGIMLVLSTHMNRVLSFNEVNQSVTVEAGISGPQLEEALNNAPQIYGATMRFTCGHFPQSFEYSTVGGWVVTLGSGQQSSYYGDARDMVISVEVVTPEATIKTFDFPAAATGPDISGIFKGSEGVFGVVMEVTWKIFRFSPEGRRYFSYMFPDWKQAVKACRNISQGEFGFPSVFRISDPEETHHGLKIYGIDGSIADRWMKIRGYKPMKRCLFIGTADGEKYFARNVSRQVSRICSRYGGIFLTGFPARRWERSRYSDPHLKDDLMDYGIIIDTLETTVRWDNLELVYRGVRDFVQQNNNVVCLTHASHFYTQGTNLYFIFILMENDPERYSLFQQGIIDVILEKGGSLSHHHGIGKLMGGRMENYLGKNQMDILRALKKHFDPNGIMNPGGQLGLP